VAVGIMIVVLQKFGVDTETENQYIPINIESIEVGNITVKPNGNKKYISVAEWFRQQSPKLYGRKS
jgi:hypothetical protein